MATLDLILDHVHSVGRWLVLGLLLFAIFNSIKKKNSGKFEKSDKMINLFAMIMVHLQATIGLILYFISAKVVFNETTMKNPMFRFFAVEHILMMLIAAVLITIGRKKSENATDTVLKHKRILVFYVIGLIIILAGIPWPGLRSFVTGWY